nr:hypothetical protein [Tanacetum cinerariifolium]
MLFDCQLHWEHITGSGKTALEVGMDWTFNSQQPQPPPEQMDEGFTATAYPKVQENLKLTVEEQVLLEEPASSLGTLYSLQHLTKDLNFAESMVSVMIQQDMSSIPPMTTLTIDLTSRPESLKVHQQLKAIATETTTTITTTLLPPPYQQQSTIEAMMMKHIGELEHIVANLIQENKRLEQRLDSHGARLYTLEQLDIHHQVSKAVNEVIMDAVDWAMQAPLQNRFKDLPVANMKEILYQRMWQTDSYKSHEDHMQLYEALVKSMNCDHSKELAKDLAEACPSKASRSLGASGSSQVPPPPPSPPSTNEKDLQMDKDMAPDEQARSLNDEDIGSAHIPKVNLRQDWWKPLKEERPASREPAWLIPSSDVPVPTNN